MIGSHRGNCQQNERSGHCPHGRHRRPVADLERERAESGLDVRHAASRSTSGMAPNLTADAIAAELQKRCKDQVRGAVVSAFGAPPIDGLGTTGGFKLIVEDRGNLGLGELQRVSEQCRRPGKSHRRPERHVQQHRRQHALALPRHRSHESRVAGRFGQRRVQHAASLSRLVLRQQFQRVRPHLAGQRAGRSEFPRPGARRSKISRCETIKGR